MAKLAGKTKGTVLAIEPVVTGAVVGTVMSLVSISFAILIFAGPLPSQIDRGIDLLLVGNLFFALCATAFGARSRVMWKIGTATAASLAAGVTHLAGVMAHFPAESIFATAVLLIVCSTTLTGLVLYFVGALRLGNAAKFVPYPVLGGFLAAIGSLLIIKGILLSAGVSTGGDSGLANLLASDMTWKWTPSFILGVVLAVASQRNRMRFALPLGAAFYALAFYAVVELVPGGLGWAGREGLLFATRLPAHGHPVFINVAALARQVNDYALIQTTPTILATPVLALLASMMSIASISASGERALDQNREMRCAGAANLIAGMMGSPPGFQAPSITNLALGVPGKPSRLTAIAAVMVSALFVVEGVALTRFLPTGLFALILVYVGGCMCYRWLWLAAHEMPGHDYALILVILGTTLAFGLVMAIVVGLIVAALLFVIAYSRVDVVRSETTGRVRRSVTERSEAADRLLTERGDETLIIELQGFLFFGAASRLLDRISANIVKADQRLNRIIIGFRRVHGMDISATVALARFARAAHESDVGIIFTDLLPHLARDFGRFSSLTDAEVLPTLDDALTQVEEQVLTGSRLPNEGPGEFTLLLARVQMQPAAGHFVGRCVCAGELLVREGAHADSLMYVESGRLSAYREVRGIRPQRVARFLPGAVLGEIGFLTGGARTASIRADVESKVVIITRAALECLTTQNPALAGEVHAFLSRLLAERLARTTALAYALV